MWQSRCANHQRRRNAEHVHRTLLATDKFLEAQILVQAVKLLQQRNTRFGDQVGAEPELRYDVASQREGNEYRRYHERQDQHAILCHLRIGDPFHAAEHRIRQDNCHADYHTQIHGNVEKSGKYDANTTHLAGNVRKRHEDRAYHSNDARRLRVITLTDKVRHGELAELAKIRRQQESQQNIAAGPPHQIATPVAAGEGNDPGHAQEGGCRHPVRGGCSTVGPWRNAFSSHVELAGRTGAGPPGDRRCRARTWPAR